MRSLCLAVLAAAAFVAPAPARAAVDLRLSLAERTLGPGDEIRIRLQVRNREGRPATVYRPMYGSWEEARAPRYRLEFVDEATGAVVPNALGHMPGLECGTMDLPGRGDQVVVAPGATARVQPASDATTLVVQPDARPGRYRMRVRYAGAGLAGAWPASLLSNAVSIEVRGGDAALWRCREDQLAALRDHVYTTVSPARLLPIDGGYLLVYSRYRHVVRGGNAEPAGDVVVQRLDATGAPAADPLVVPSNVEVGYLAAEAVPDGLLVAYTPGPVGGRSVRVVHIDGASIRPGAPIELQPGPGNPYVTALARSGDRVGLLHHGGDARDGALLFTALDLHGRPAGAPALIEAGGYTSIATLEADPGGFRALWQEPGIRGGTAVLDRLDGFGRRIDRRSFPLAGRSVVRARVRADAVDLVFHDNQRNGSDPRDRMGLGLITVPDAGPAGSVVALGPQDVLDPHFGTVAWAGSTLGRVYGDRQGADIHFAIGLPGRPSLLTATAYGDARLTATGDRFLVVWSDTRDDTSTACRELRECVAEAYIAVIDAGGRTLVAPRRISRDARAKPLRPPDDGWQRFCRPAI